MFSFLRNVQGAPQKRPLFCIFHPAKAVSQPDRFFQIDRPHVETVNTGLFLYEDQ
jgi:hypothetical protein